jgi:hypothetical protein
VAEQNVTSCELCRFFSVCHRKDTPDARNGLCSIFKKRGTGVVRHDQFMEARVAALEKRMDVFESMGRGMI